MNKTPLKNNIDNQPCYISILNAFEFIFSITYSPSILQYMKFKTGKNNLKINQVLNLPSPFPCLHFHKGHTSTHMLQEHENVYG